MNNGLTIGSFFPMLTSDKLGERRQDISNTTYVGIDFGTSTTVVSIATLQDGEPSVISKPIELNQQLLEGTIHKSYKVPTVIGWYNNKLLVGEGASKLKHKLRLGHNLWHSFKMDLGEDVGCKYPNSELGKEHKLVSILNPKDAARLFFMYLKKQINNYIAQNNLSTKVEYAVSIPASFEANQRRDLIESLESNGFAIAKQSLIDEPNAAFLSYVQRSGFDNNPIQVQEGYYPNVLVFDFGAGTCDISILEVGRDNNGVYSKNIAISRFEKLGGDDIDRLIAVDILLPQLLSKANLKVDDFRTKELRDLIIPKLLKPAELLKIELAEAIELQMQIKTLPQIALSSDKISVGTKVEIETRYGLLTLDEPTLTFKEFAGINSIFTSTGSKSSFSKDLLIGPAKRIEGEEEFISVFNPIKSALKKAQLDNDDIDYVLFIGGSSKNPFIRKAVSEYFNESEILVPRDLQAHVSAGAAIHSLFYNGFGKNIIQPITSEPIMLVTKDGYMEKVEPIIEAGVTIPSELKSIDNLRAQRDGQDVIELPICVGSKNKLLYNIKLSAPDAKGFSRDTPVKLALEINADKLLMIKATAGDKSVMVEPLSPFANQELTTEQRVKLKAEKEYNLACERNGGQPTLEALEALHKAYNKIELHLKAAETLEQIEELFPGEAILNNIGLHYKNAGKKDKATLYYEKAMEQTPCATTAFNIAIHLKDEDADKSKSYLEKALDIDAEHKAALYNLAILEKRAGNIDEAIKMLNKAFEGWHKKFESNSLANWEYGWFASCASELGKKDFAEVIRESRPSESLDKLYNFQNLTELDTETGLITT
jgi:molecular chaperone DnaK